MCKKLFIGGYVKHLGITQNHLLQIHQLDKAVNVYPKDIHQLADRFGFCKNRPNFITTLRYYGLRHLYQSFLKGSLPKPKTPFGS